VLLTDLSAVPVKAKIDTGARTSSLHAFDLTVTTGGDGPVAEFEIHPIQRSRDHAVRVSHPVRGFRNVRSSSGHREERPVIRTRISLGAQEFFLDLTLTSRDEMGFRMLLGRAALRRRFWIDPAGSFLQPKLSAPPRGEV
jgi:hypothetical protein